MGGEWEEAGQWDCTDQRKGSRMPRRGVGVGPWVWGLSESREVSGSAIQPLRGTWLLLREQQRQSPGQFKLLEECTR